MRCSAVVLGVILLASAVHAQSERTSPQLPIVPAPAEKAVQTPDTSQGPTLWADAAPFTAPAEAEPVSSATGEPDPAQAAPVYSVRPYYAWQLYAGYTFFRFYEVPTLKNLENGFDVDMTYFPGAGWIGVEGDLMATFGSQAGCISKFTLATGGVRFRWAGPRGTQFFLHGVAGGSHFFPQTAYGSQNALGYEMGGGMDISAHHRRMAYRFEVDAVGTRYFGTYQYSPKASAGIVFNF
jgi:hypothetical protein